METSSSRELVNLEIKLFLNQKLEYPKKLRIPFSYCGEMYKYELEINSLQNSSKHIRFIYKSTFLNLESLKQRKNYLNSRIELGWFDLLPDSLNYNHRIVSSTKMQESLSKILCFTIQNMKFNFQTYLPVFLCELETLTQSSIKLLFQNFKEMNNNKSNALYFEIKYPRKYKKFDPKQEKKLDSEHIHKKKLDSKNIQLKKFDSEDVQKEEFDSEYNQTEKVDPEHNRTEKIDSEYIKKEKIDPEHNQTEQIVSKYIKKEKIDPEHNQTEKNDSEYIQKKKIDPEHNQPEQIVSKYIKKEKTDPEHNQKEKIDPEHNQPEQIVSKYIKKEKTDPEHNQKEKIDRFSKDLMILEKFVKNEELFRFFMPFTTIDFKRNIIKFPQFLANVRKVSIKEVYKTTIIDKLRDIYGLLRDIKMHMDARIILDNLFRSKESHYFVLIKKPIFIYILDKKISLEQHSDSVKKVCNSHSFRFSSLEDHTFKAITKFALIEKDSNIIELPNQFIDRYLEFKSINSKNLITIQGLFQEDSSKYYIVTENFQRKSYYTHFFKIQDNAINDNETRSILLTEFMKTILDLLDLIYVCDIKRFGFLDFSNEYLDFSSGVVKLIPSFKNLSIDVLSPEEISIKNRNHDVYSKSKITGSNIYRLGLLIFNIIFKKLYQRHFINSDKNLIENFFSTEPSNVDQIFSGIEGLYIFVKGLLSKDINIRPSPQEALNLFYYVHMKESTN